MSALVGACLAAGLFFHGVAALGVLRMPDFYTRLHAVSKAETLGVVLTLAGVAAASDSALTALKIAVVAIFLFLANPTATHALGRAAFRLGMPPWTGEPEPDR